MPRFSINDARINQTLHELGQVGDSPEGMDRVAYSPEDIAGRDFTIKLMQEAGLETRVDTAGNIVHVDNPSKLPPANEIDELREPIITANILVPEKHVGAVIKLCVEKRGVQKHIRYLGDQVSIEYELPLVEVVLDFFDRLKSVSRGFASFDYHFERFEPANLVRLDVLINKERVDALSIIVHRASAQQCRPSEDQGQCR